MIHIRRLALAPSVRLWIVIAICIGMSTQGLGDPPKKAKPRYRVIDLGTLPGCDVTYATSVNDAGWVVGYAYPFVPPGHGNSVLSRPFLWRKGVLSELPKLGGEYGQALTINAQGDVGGYVTTKEADDLPVIWQKDRQYRPRALSTKGGSVRALLDDGTAVGDVSDGSRSRAALWAGGKTQVLGNEQDVESTATSVNRAGMAVGFFIPKGGSAESIWSPGSRHAALWKGGQQIALPELEPSNTLPAQKQDYRSECLAINEEGIAVGWSVRTNGNQACLWKNGKVEALPALDGFATEAHAINKSGVIVGKRMR